MRPAPEKSAEHKHEVNKPTNRAPSSPNPVLPAAPKFETNRKIPPIGSALGGQAQTNHPHGTAKPDGGKLPVVTTPPAKRPDRDRDHVQPDRNNHPDHNHANAPRSYDPYGHHHHNYGHSHRSGWSWLIVGGATPLGGGWYGPGYGPSYGGWSNNVYVPVPVQTYVPAASAVPVPAVSNALPQPPRTNNEDFFTLPVIRQRELLLQALNALEDDLARSPNGDDWSRHLQLATAAKFVGEGDAPIEATTRARLRSVVELFDEVGANQDYRAISELLSFRASQAGLREFATEPIGQARGRLSRTADQFSRKLQTWPTGERWKDYLQVGWLVGTEEEEKLDMPERLVRFEKLLAKFDRVKADDQFQVVSEEPTFGATHAALQVFVRELRIVIRESIPENLELPKAPGGSKLPSPKAPE